MRRYFEPVQVVTDRKGIPSRIDWRGRTFVVACVQDRWRYCGRWWLDGQGKQRHYFRLEVRPASSAHFTSRTRSLELYREGRDWTLSQLCD